MKRGAMWPIGIVAVLGLTVAANIWVYTIAKADPSFVIEPNYYAKAIAWDSTLAQGRRNEALGWRLAPALGAFSTGGGAHLSVTVTDAAGAKVENAVVTVAALYVARAAAVVTDTLVPDAAGYSATIDVQHSGQWELRFDVTRGAEHFTATSRLDAVRAPSQ
jgi:nitrogen fixation protein FixH